MSRLALGVIALGAFFTAPTPALAQDRWVLVGSTGDTDTYVDRSTIRRTGNVVRYWLKREYQNDAMKRSQARVLTEIDCDQGRIRYLQIAYYFLDGTNDSKPGGAVWEFVAPDTIADGQLRFVCR